MVKEDELEAAQIKLYELDRQLEIISGHCDTLDADPHSREADRDALANRWLQLNCQRQAALRTVERLRWRSR